MLNYNVKILEKNESNCLFSGLCYNIPCKNGATCTDTGTGTGFTCTCAEGWEGPTCQG